MRNLENKILSTEQPTPALEGKEDLKEFQENIVQNLTRRVNKFFADVDLFKEAEKYIRKNDFASAKDMFLLMDDPIDQGALLETRPQFREFYENSCGTEARKWLANENNKIDSSFNPQTAVREILKQPSGPAREEALQNYKDNLVRQTEALANITVTTEFKFRNTPQIKEEEFLAELEKYGAAFALSDEQQKVYRQAFKKFESRRETVDGLLEKFPDARDLYQELFGAAPEGHIQLLSRSATLAFRCDNRDDYSRMSSKEGEADTSHGFFRMCALQDSAGEKTYVPIIGELVKNASKGIDSYTFSTTLIHEEQHAFKHLFEEPKYKARFFDNSIKRLDSEQQQQNVNQYLGYKAHKMSFDDEANEILAQFKGKPYGAQYLPDRLSTYDFKSGVAESEKRYLQERFAGDPLGEKVGEYVDSYFSKNYARTVSQGIEAVQELYKSLHDGQKVTALLLNESLSNWPKVAKRVLEKLS